MRRASQDRLSSMWSKSEWILVALILALAFIIRIAGLGAESAWIDEGYSIVLARHGILDIIRGTAADQHPPLYYLVLHFWLGMGDSVWNARLLSVILGLVSVCQVLVFGYKLGGKFLGLGAAALLAINPMHVWYSQEARQYMLLTVLTTASMMELWDCLHGKRRWVTYGVVTLLAIYTQYFAAFILLSQASFLTIWYFWQRERQTVREWLITFSGIGLCFLPWLPTAVNQFLYHTMPWIGEPAATEIRDIPLRLMLGSGVLLLPALIRWIGIVGFVTAFLWSVRLSVNDKSTSAREFGYVSVWGLLPYLVISLVAIFYPLFQFKQFLFLLPAFLILATAITGRFPGRWRHLAYVCLLAIPLMSMVYQQSTLTKDDWRGLSEHIETNYEHGDVVYTNPAGAALVLELYIEPSIPVEGYPPDFNILTGGWQGQVLSNDIAEEELGSISASSKRIWLIEFSPEFWDANKLLPAWLSENATLMEDQQFGDIRMRLYQF